MIPLILVAPSPMMLPFAVKSPVTVATPVTPRVPPIVASFATVSATPGPETFTPARF